MLKDFYQTLFDRGQATCFSADVRGTAVERVKVRTDRMFFSINALDPERDHQPTETYHRPDRPRRADHNIVCYRNILIEMDHGSLEEQAARIRDIALPWSTCVSSGGKSLHFLISLREPLADRMAYARLVKQLYAALSGKIKVDNANKNPSRFSRCPGALRQETGRLQKLIGVQERVDNAILDLWIRRNSAPDLSLKPQTMGRVLTLPVKSRIFPSTEAFLRSGAPAGEWNTGLFRAACNLFSTGVSFDEATDKFRRITGTLDARDLATIKSAFRRIQTDREA